MHWARPPALGTSAFTLAVVRFSRTLATRVMATTKTYAALLRGINVGGARKVKMEDLRQLFADLGYADVTSYVQSGNLVFSSTRSDQTRLCKSIEERILAELGLDVTVLVR